MTQFDRLIYFIENENLNNYFYVVNNFEFKFQITLLKLLGVNDNRIIVWDNKTTRVEILIIPSLRFDYINNYKIYSQEAIIKFRKIISNQLHNLPNNNYDKIYIKRKNNKRKIDNEKVLIEKISKLGFKIIVLEELSEYEIMTYFKNAKIIIGIHGAGFANIVYSIKTKVIELLPNYISEYAVSVFYQLTMKLDFDHYVVCIKKERNSQKHLIDISKVIDLI